MKYKAIIIDDEEMARTLLQGMIDESCANVDVVDLCKDLSSGVKSIRKHKPDIVFLDIEMPGHSGLELIDFFDEKEIDFSIIFVTAYNQYAIQAFKLSAVDYLLKPIEISDLQNAVELFEKNRNKANWSYKILKENFITNQSKKIALATLNSISFVDTNDILFFQGDGAYTKVYTIDNKVITVSKGLKNFETILESNPHFFRCHKSFIVNINYITEYVKSEGGYLVVNKTHHVSISADKTDLVLEKIQLGNV